MVHHQPKEATAAVFVDRDGVINRRVTDGYVLNVNQLDVLEGIVPLLQRATQAGTAIVIVTNQGAISRDLLSEGDLMRIHQQLVDRLHERGVLINAIYACPHHPLASNVADRSCECRKPSPGLIDAAAVELSLDLIHSAFIGDQDTDRLAARAAGIPDEAISVVTVESATVDQVEALDAMLARRFGWP
jgi:D-glycero-D-manno-heptose 1,7-bisphosphate phosphatase